MPKQKISISLDTEIAEKLRLQSMKKYGNSRSMSRLIEDLATGAAEAEQPDACSILGHRTAVSLKFESEFNKDVEKIRAKLSEIELYHELTHNGKTSEYGLSGEEMYFTLKEACELEINKWADVVNVCWTCAGLNGPVPKYPTAGKNFELFATFDNNRR